MLNKITYDNVVKGLIAISLLFMAFGAKAADFSGSVGVSSDNYFRGVNMSDGAGYSVKGLVDLDNGIFAGASVMSLDDRTDLMTKAVIGYGRDLGGVKVDVAYIDYGYQGLSLDGWEEVAVKAYFDKFAVQYSKGLDNAGDTYIVSSDALEIVDVAYGDSDLTGSWFEVSKSFDLGGGSLNVGYVDHEANDDDFADMITDIDNFYVGYSYKF